MGLFNFMRNIGIDEGVEEWKQSAGGILVDVRTAEEYRQGHLPGSINIPLDQIKVLTPKTANRNVPLFVYCRSGSRAGQAVSVLRQMGYTQVKNIGGISAFHGKIVR